MINTRNQARHPFEVFTVIALGASGVAQLVGRRAPSTIEKTVPLSVAMSWSGLLFFGAVVCLFGIAWKDEVLGQYFEIAGLLAMAFGLSAYGVSVIITSTAPWSSLAAPLTMMFAAACLVRCWQILRVLRYAVREGQAMRRRKARHGHQ